MSLCWHGGEAHEVEPEPPPTECDGCGAPQGTLSIYSVPLNRAWCCRTCKDGGRCECAEGAG